MRTFDEAWAEKVAAGYQYGEEALEQVRFGWEMRQVEVDDALSLLGRGVELFGEDDVKIKELRRSLRDTEERLRAIEARLAAADDLLLRIDGQLRRYAAVVAGDGLSAEVRRAVEERRAAEKDPRHGDADGKGATGKDGTG